MLPVAAPPLRDGAVLVEDGAIAAVGTADQARGWPAADAVDDHGPHALVMPGLVDAHCHLEWSCFDGVVGPRPFGEWLRAFLPLRARMEPGDHAAAARHGALRAARAGTTTLADAGPTGAGVGALATLGMRGVVHLEAFGAPAAGEAPRAAAEVARRGPARAGEAPPRVRVGVSPHAPYSAGPALWRALAGEPALAGVPWTAHLAESADEERAVLAATGPIADLFAEAGFPMGRWDRPAGAGGAGDSVVARVAAAGALRPGLIAAHCVRLRAGDIRRLRDAATHVAHCPRSNGHLACGAAPVPGLLEAGVPVAIGTDSPASGGDYDLRAEARACRALFGAAGPDDRRLVGMITRDGARALGLGDAVGALAPGMRADLLVLDAAGAGGSADPHALALSPRTRVRETLVDGEPVVRGGAHVAADGEAIGAAAAAVAARLR